MIEKSNGSFDLLEKSALKNLKDEVYSWKIELPKDSKEKLKNLPKEIKNIVEEFLDDKTKDTLIFSQLTQKMTDENFSDVVDILTSNEEAASRVLKLNISWNDITKIPWKINDLKNISIFSAQKNKITKLPDDWDSSSITEINMNNNLLGSFCRQFSKISSLKKLYIKNNWITIIPSQFISLNSLEELNLGNDWTNNPNKLTNLKSTENSYEYFKWLQNLKTLNLSWVWLDSLPEEDISQHLLLLENLDLSNNNLTNLPDWIVNLWWTINLSTNNLNNIPYLWKKPVTVKILWNPWLSTIKWTREENYKNTNLALDYF